ncbi:YjjG family noncanonical pyrimidine nucleotidase [Flavisolibacter tropicus]|uniref:Haloacid dehalogenase n=1 Tax=Flavisolibacter tropicus TaxID=1492898 RepID=A0A172TY72_9BACT|nr:YjjG family noncanonical pyrimidine nucleotidase [Flavisolibacter tropicus]ANE51990.1 haloacid dehalogenase [Flavisolibacter tropicus]
MKYKHIFFDLDHTLWDFDANARATLHQMHQDLNLAERGVHDFELFHTNYLAHNERLWERYRKGQIRQDELRLKRMRLALLDFKIGDEELAREMGETFVQLLPTRTIIFPDTIEVLQYLTEKGYHLHLITNGFVKTQYSKLSSCGLDVFFKEVITSEGSNCLKPEKEIFEYALGKAGASVKESIMIGDALDIDILGAMNVGMDQIHVNFNRIDQHIKPTYTVYALKELKDIL